MAADLRYLTGCVVFQEGELSAGTTPRYVKLFPEDRLYEAAAKQVAYTDVREVA